MSTFCYNTSNSAKNLKNITGTINTVLCPKHAYFLVFEIEIIYLVFNKKLNKIIYSMLTDYY